MASCGLWVCQEDLLQDLAEPILRQSSHAQAPPLLEPTAEALEPAALPLDGDAVDLELEDVIGLPQQITSLWALSPLWLFVVVDACVAVLISATCAWRWHTSKSTGVCTQAEGEADSIGILGAVASASAQVADTMEATMNPQLASAADSEVRSSSEVMAFSSMDMANSPSSAPSTTEAAVVLPRCASPQPIQAASPRSSSPTPHPSPCSSFLRMTASPAASTPEGRASSQRCRTMAPKGVSEWLASRRSPASKATVSDFDANRSVQQGDDRYTSVDKKTPVKVVSTTPIPAAVPTSSPRPKGVQEWLSRHQSPICKPSSLEEAFGSSSAAADHTDAPTPSRGTVRSTTPARVRRVFGGRGGAAAGGGGGGE